MNPTQIHDLQTNGPFKDAELIETHISWVFIAGHHVYKIKKPIRYPFLDFSTLKKRKFYCKKELELNRRWTRGVYLSVDAIRKTSDKWKIGGRSGEVIDYAVHMRKLDPDRRMDKLLLSGKVTIEQIQLLAKRLANLHKDALIVHPRRPEEIANKFNDLQHESSFLEGALGKRSGQFIKKACEISARFVAANQQLLIRRVMNGMFRDVHGDLHSRNIFLLRHPLFFDCIEFNDDYRCIDLLNEVAFLCMDLDSFGKKELSEALFKCYNSYSAIAGNEQEWRLYVYYKFYRANVRAKVNSLRAREIKSISRRRRALAEVSKYLRLMNKYLVFLT